MFLLDLFSQVFLFLLMPLVSSFIHPVCLLISPWSWFRQTCRDVGHCNCFIYLSVWFLLCFSSCIFFIFLSILDFLCCPFFTFYLTFSCPRFSLYLAVTSASSVFSLFYFHSYLAVCPSSCSLILINRYDVASTYIIEIVYIYEYNFDEASLPGH